MAHEQTDQPQFPDCFIGKWEIVTSNRPTPTAAVIQISQEGENFLLEELEPRPDGIQILQYKPDTLTLEADPEATEFPDRCIAFWFRRRGGGTKGNRIVAMRTAPAGDSDSQKGLMSFESGDCTETWGAEEGGG